MKKSPIPFLRKIALVEAVSLLLLMGIAMPLKYIWNMPLPVKVVGWIHGVLFIIFCVALAQTTLAAKWSLGRSAVIFIAAILPFGPFIVDRRMKGYEAEFQQNVIPTGGQERVSSDGRDS